jgi:hypothetical protein
MKTWGFSLLLFFIFSFFSLRSVAQLSPDDSVFYRNALHNTAALYHQSIGDQSGLYNGSRYADYPFRFRDQAHPFFKSDILSVGSVVYDNVLYGNAGLLYDEVSDVLIFQDASHRLQLVSERVSGFTLLDNNFIRILKDSLNRSGISTGFYNLLYEGNVRVLKKEIKSIKEDVQNNTERVIRYIEVKRYYYIKRGDRYYVVKRKKDLTEIYKDRKKEILQFIKSKKLNFKSNKDIMLAAVSAYYDLITK